MSCQISDWKLSCHAFKLIFHISQPYNRIGLYDNPFWHVVNSIKINIQYQATLQKLTVGDGHHGRCLRSFISLNKVCVCVHMKGMEVSATYATEKHPVRPVWIIITLVKALVLHNTCLLSNSFESQNATFHHNVKDFIHTNYWNTTRQSQGL